MSTQPLSPSSFLLRLRPTLLLVAWCGLALGLSACGGRSADMATDTKTNWLGSCEADSDCAGGLDCLCGVCTRECDAEDACNGLAGAECSAMSGCGDVALVCTSPDQNADDAAAPGAADESTPETSDDATQPPGDPDPEPAPTDDSSETDPEGDDSAPTSGPTEPGSEPMPPAEDSDAGAQQCPRPSEDYALLGDECLLADFACASYFIDECGCGCEDEPSDAGEGELCGRPRDEYRALGDACLTARFACDEGAEMFTNECGCGCTLPVDDAGALDCEDPARHYVARSPAQCAASLFMCESGTTMFYDTCGCGCLFEGDAGAACESDARDYKSHDPQQCQVLDFVCEDGTAYFGDECGCGCETQTEVPANCEPAPGSAVPADVLQLGLDACYYNDAVQAAAGLIESDEELLALFEACESSATEVDIDFTQKRLFVAVVNYAPNAEFNYAVEDEGVVHVGVEAGSWCQDAQPPAGIVAVALDIADSSVAQDTCQTDVCAPL